MYLQPRCVIRARRQPPPPLASTQGVGYCVHSRQAPGSGSYCVHSRSSGGYCVHSRSSGGGYCVHSRQARSSGKYSASRTGLPSRLRVTRA